MNYLTIMNLDIINKVSVKNTSINIPQINEILQYAAQLSHIIIEMYIIPMLEPTIIMAISTPPL